jgi:hypothetical protein
MLLHTTITIIIIIITITAITKVVDDGGAGLKRRARAGGAGHARELVTLQA